MQRAARPHAARPEAPQPLRLYCPVSIVKGSCFPDVACSHTMRHRCHAVQSPDKSLPQAPSGAVQPDFNIDDLFNVMPTPQPSQAGQHLQQQAVKPPQRASRRSQQTPGDAAAGSPRLKGDSSISSSSQTHADPAATGQASAKLARMLQSARGKRTQNQQTPQPEQQQHDQRPGQQRQHQLQQQEQLQQPHQQQSPAAAASQPAVLHPPNPAPTTLPPALTQASIDDPTAGQQPNQGPHPPADVHYGALQTTHRRRSKLFNLDQPVPMPPLSLASRLGPRSIGAGAASSTDDATASDSGQPPEGSPVLVTSTRQATRRRRRGQPARTSGTAAILPPPQLVGVHLDSWLREPSSSAPPWGPPSLPLPTPPGSFPQRTPSASNLLALGSGPQQPAQAQLSRPPAPSAPSPQQQAVPISRQSVPGAPRGQQVSPALPPVTLGSWGAVASEEWPQLFSPGYHTCLYEFLFDLWGQAGKNADQGRHQPVQRAFVLLSRCWASPDVLVRHTAVLSLAECLADSEGLAACAATTIQPQALLCDALIPLARWLHPDDFKPGEALYDFHQSAIARCRCDQQPPSFPAQGTPQPGSAPKRRGRPRKQTLSPTPDRGPQTPKPDTTGSSAGMEWQLLMLRLQAQQVAYPAISLGILISLDDGSME